MNSFFLFFVGHTHGFIDDFEKQREIIKAVKPEFVLCESLENLSLVSKEDYNNILNKRKISNMSSFEENENLIRFCFEKNIKLIGMDLENFGFSEIMQNKIKKQHGLTEEEDKEIERILKKRSEHHLEIIKEYLKKTKNPIVVILGSWHLRDDSLLMNKLENYKVIFPCDENGNLLIEPTNGKISYCERIK